MIVDEPTNHLAPVLVEQLEAALASFEGTLVIVSHDRALGVWFDRCARADVAVEHRRGPVGTGGHWVRYGMQGGELL